VRRNSELGVNQARIEQLQQLNYAGFFVQRAISSLFFGWENLMFEKLYEKSVESLWVMKFPRNAREFSRVYALPAPLE